MYECYNFHTEKWSFYSWLFFLNQYKAVTIISLLKFPMMLQYTLWTYPSWFSMSQENRMENIDFLLATAMTVSGSGSWSSNYRDQQCYYHSPRLVCLLYFCNHILKNFFRECTFLLSPSHICLTPFCLTNSDDWTITGDNVLLVIWSEWVGCQKNGGLLLLIMKILKANENENV